MTKDSNTTGKRLTRYARVSTAMGGLAARVAGEKFLGIKIDRADHAEALKNALGNLRGPLMKVAQLLSTIPNALPPEYTQELQQLQANAPPMGWPFVRRRMQAELGADWESKFRDFPRTATAAASLGQVHKAVTKDGKKVACKLQYADMDSAVDADLKQLKILLGLYERYDSAVQTKFILEEVSERLREELDYTREAKQCAMYADILNGEHGVHVPHVIPDLCATRLLTTEWLDGQDILSFQSAPQETRNTIALNLFRAWYVPLYHYGIIHGDPHPGNYTVRNDLSLNLLDFGCIRVFPTKFVQGILDLYNALQTDDNALAVKAYEAWGFQNLTKELIDILNIWAGFLFAPLLEDKVRVIGRSEKTVYGRDTAMRVYQALRERGGVAVPREFVFMDRAALGLGSVFIRLGAEVNWYRVFNELIQDFDAKALHKRQQDMLKRHKL